MPNSDRSSLAPPSVVRAKIAAAANGTQRNILYSFRIYLYSRSVINLNALMDTSLSDPSYIDAGIRGRRRQRTFIFDLLTRKTAGEAIYLLLAALSSQYVVFIILINYAQPHYMRICVRR